MRFHTLIGGALIATALAGCSDDTSEGEGAAGSGAGGASGAGGGGGGAPKPGWTVLLYSSADNDLEEPMMGDVRELMEAGSAEGVTVLAQIDRSGEYFEGDVGGLGDWTGAKRVRIEKGALRELADLGELDSGAPDALADFVAWGLAQAPAERVMLVLSDHGNLNQFGVDETNGTRLDLAGIGDALGRGLASSGRAKFDLVGFDACLMGNWETASVLAPHADFLIASEEVVPGHGYDYRAFGRLVEAPATTPVELGKHLIASFGRAAQEQGTADFVTMSLLDLGRFGEIDRAVGQLASALGEGELTAKGPLIGAQYHRSVRFSDTLDQSTSPHLVDLGNFAKNLSASDPGAYGQVAGRVESALGAFVVDRVAGRAYVDATGLAIHLPPPGYYDPSYDRIAGTAPWRDWLKSYGASAGRVVVRPAFADGAALALAGDEAGGLGASAALAPGAAPLVTEATLIYGLRDPETEDTVFLGAVEARVEGDQARGEWDGKFVSLNDGKTKAPALHNVTAVGSGLLKLEVPLAYTKPGTTEPRLLLFTVYYDGASGMSTGTPNFLVNYQNAWASLTADMLPPGPYQSLALVRPANGGPLELRTTGPELVFDDFAIFADLNRLLSFEPAPAGSQAVVALQIYDYAEHVAEVEALAAPLAAPGRALGGAWGPA